MNFMFKFINGRNCLWYFAMCIVPWSFYMAIMGELFTGDNGDLFLEAKKVLKEIFSLRRNI